LHVVDVRSRSGNRAALHEEAGPASPAFQDLHVETLGPGIVEVQAMGQASRNIYSCAVRFDAAQRSIDFDFAARLRVVTAASVATAYRLTASPEATVECSPHQLVMGTVSQHLLTITCEEPGVALVLGHGDDAGGRLLTAGHVGWSELIPGRTGVTVRWKLRMEIGE
jgi:hypothetical protein